MGGEHPARLACEVEEVDDRHRALSARTETREFDCIIATGSPVLSPGEGGARSSMRTYMAVARIKATAAVITVALAGDILGCGNRLDSVWMRPRRRRRRRSPPQTDGIPGATKFGRCATGPV